MTEEPDKPLWWRVRWMEAVWRSDLKPLEKLVASVYADHAGDQRMAWVTLDRLRDRSGLSRDAANRALRGVRDAGWLVVMESARQHRATVYMLSIPDTSALPSSTPAVPLSADSSTGDVPLEGVSSTPDGPLEGSSSTPHVASSTPDDTSSTPRVPNPSSDQSSNPSSSSSPARHLLAHLLGIEEDDDRLDLTNDFLTHCGVKRAQAWLSKVHGEGDLQRLFDEFVAANADPWLGAANTSGDDTWLTTPKPTTEEYIDLLHEIVGADEADDYLDQEAQGMGLDRDSWLVAKNAWITARHRQQMGTYAAKEAS